MRGSNTVSTATKTSKPTHYVGKTKGPSAVVQKNSHSELFLISIGKAYQWSQLRSSISLCHCLFQREKMWLF